ncbi:Uncharacterised protein [Mycobacteroides abscessus subsp. bolletii]|uniref:hypothetical protein n=1 Tax=Mycobacteroides abscessus TaxID=36809 RepID=UPI00092CAC15|nr:hypothetical protein [Mycobacteroides abscessus]SIJ03665.1 Uncharacterised protein [Mycobacteroides abscessus subsp. bolletii]SLD76932.1 Uncharacterised protein [Mycobacteroides abscessus subsp. bolletii]SLD84141.1 Uncharacterised protein [Mycobacteroides abscessus subsp. bolletii]
MEDFPWVQAIVGAVTILGTALKLPAARLDWGEEHRRVARIERQASVMEKVSHPSVKRVFEDDNELQALKLIALRKFPYRRRLRLAVYGGRVAYVGSVVLVVCSIWFDWGTFYLALCILGVLIAFFMNYHAINRLKLHRTNRRMFALLGAPDRFRFATQSMVPRQDRPKKKRHISSELELRAKTWKWKDLDITRGEADTEMWCIWNEILDDQAAPRIAKGEQLRERLEALNETDPRPELADFLRSRIDKTQGRMTRRLEGRIRERPKLPWVKR